MSRRGAACWLLALALTAPVIIFAAVLTLRLHH